MADTMNQDYDNMSRDQLLNIIGQDISPDTPHEDLVAMARQRGQRDSDMGLNAS